MKNILRPFLLTVFIAIAALYSRAADTYQIVRLNTPTITINGKQLTKGKTFSEKDMIRWADDSQSMEVKNLRTGRLHRLSAKAMRSKWDALSIGEFLVATTKGSTRGKKGEVLFGAGLNKGKFPDKRIALVIGNSDYEHQSYLRNAQKDAGDVANTLRKLGFDVYETYECDYEEMKQALGAFQKKCQGYDIALFYYAGHGLQDEGVNYLIPIDAKLEMRSELKSCLNADDVVYALEQSGARDRLAFFDACRDVKHSWSRSAQQGLARMEGGPGSVIMFSTASGKIAYDGEEDNSPFAASLMTNITKNSSFPETMAAIARDTYRMTQQRQSPLQVGNLMSDFAFNPAGVNVGNAPRAMPSTPSDSVAANKTPAPSVATTVPPAATSPAQQGMPAPNISFVSGILVNVASCKRNGSDVDIELIFTNRTGSTKQPHFDRRGNDCYALDNFANEYRLGGASNSNRISLLGDDGNDYSNSANLLLQPDVPTKLSMRISNVPSSVSSFPIINQYCNLDAQKMLTIKDLYIGYQAAPSTAPQGKHFTTCTAPNLTAQSSAAVRRGDSVIFTLYLTNTGSSQLTAYITDSVQKVGSDRARTSFTTLDGTAHIHRDRDFVFMRGDSRTTTISLPQGIRIPVTVRLKGVPENENVIPNVSIVMRGVDNGNPYGEAQIVIKNLPVN